MRRSAWNTLAAAAALVFGLASCTDPTVAPKSNVTGANFFGDPSSYAQFVAKIYAGLAVGGQNGGDGSTDIAGIDGGFSQYLRLYWEMEELPTDEAVIAWGDQTLPEMNTQGWSPSNTFVNAMYYRVYFQVGMANEFLRQTTDAQLAARGVSAALKAKIHTYRAEARFLRALAYWHGLDFFGGIPLATETDALGATAPAQVTRAQLYTYVVSELTAIRDSLPQPGAAPDVATYGRATGPAADMLLAELYLNAAVYTGAPNYAGALTEASSVINSGLYQLNPVYRNNFTADNNNSPELIFAVPEDGLHTQTYGSTNFIIHASCGNAMNNANYGVDGCWWGLRMKPSAYYLYAARDSRGTPRDTVSQTIPVASLSTFANGATYPKFTNKTSTGATGSNPAFADTDFPMFRLGEAYLIYIEAHVRGGGGTDAQALQYFNQLRVRAYGDSSAVATSIAQVTLDTVLAERGRELMWEAHRRTDLVRFGLFTGPSYIWAWKGANAYGKDSTGIATDAHLNLYPIPANELIANPNVKQNTGY